jgi:hypothetical protein
MRFGMPQVKARMGVGPPKMPLCADDRTKPGGSARDALGCDVKKIYTLYVHKIQSQVVFTYLIINQNFIFGREPKIMSYFIIPHVVFTCLLSKNLRSTDSRKIRCPILFARPSVRTAWQNGLASRCRASVVPSGSGSDVWAKPPHRQMTYALSLQENCYVWFQRYPDHRR